MNIISASIYFLLLFSIAASFSSKVQNQSGDFYNYNLFDTTVRLIAIGITGASLLVAGILLLRALKFLAAIINAVALLFTFGYMVFGLVFWEIYVPANFTSSNHYISEIRPPSIIVISFAIGAYPLITFIVLFLSIRRKEYEIPDAIYGNKDDAYERGTEYYCDSCSATVSETDEFCSNCGEKFHCEETENSDEVVL